MNVISPSIQYLPLNIPAGATIDVYATGQIFSCKLCSAAAPLVTVNFNDGLPCPIAAGLTIDYAKVVNDSTAVFKKLQFKNNDIAQASVAYFVGGAGVTFNPVDSKAAPTILIGNLGAGTALSPVKANFTGGVCTNLANLTKAPGIRTGLTRKQIIVVNNDLSVDLLLVDKNGFTFSAINCQTSRASILPFVFETSDDVYFGGSTGALSGVINIGEIFYAQ